MGRSVTVTDIRAEEELKGLMGRLAPSVEVVAGGHPPSVFDGADLLVVSPGVPLDIEPIKRARRAGIEVIGELELAYRLMKDIPFYAVTGTNGKSTTVTLLDLMMRKSGMRSLLGGNIGNPLTGELSGRVNGRPRLGDIDCVVAEVSSFQLDSIVEFAPAGAAVLNITPDHMDRYGSMQDYREAKARIFLNQGGEDFLVLNADDPETMELYKPARSTGVKVSLFSRRKEVDGVYLRGGKVYFGRYPVLGAAEIGISGVHNLENAMAASGVALLAGCPEEAVADSMREFEGLEHRLEFVRELNGVRYINDSKGTNVGAAVKSIESFSGGDASVVLIAGGRDKEGDFGVLAEAAKGKVKAAVLIGEARRKIKDAFSGHVECLVADDLEDAVDKASSLASGGDVVLLSPACASFDMFRDFEDRGRRFKGLVQGL
jgi:UDP-N-acetylmuramoylalanine--D-glutamate ligase